MKEIASEIAALTASYETGCEDTVRNDAHVKAVNSDRADLSRYLDKLEKDPIALHGERDAREPDAQKFAEDQKAVETDEAQLAATKTALNIHVNALDGHLIA